MKHNYGKLPNLGRRADNNTDKSHTERANSALKALSVTSQQREIAMALVNVTFRNPVDDSMMTNAQVDDASTVAEVISNLVQHNFVPPAKQGQHYVLQIKGKAELSDDGATLRSGGATDSDVINVVLAQRGGTGNAC